MYGVEGYNISKDMSEGDEGYSKIAQDINKCFGCGLYKNRCMLCKENDYSSFCVNNELNYKCEDKWIDKADYQPNCTDFDDSAWSAGMSTSLGIAATRPSLDSNGGENAVGESKKGSSSSAGKTSQRATTLALVSAAIFYHQ